ncbi:hypothetical protein MMC07_007000, partial [Pseudocyphellaria aurata]|nr:hypothetical protein [Pseudocyphellaria aurata]
MSDPNNPNIKERSTPQWSLYQRENFWKPNTGEVPLFNTEPGKLEELAKEKLTQGGWFYASSNAGLSHTHLANRTSASTLSTPQQSNGFKVKPSFVTKSSPDNSSTPIFETRARPSLATKVSLLPRRAVTPTQIWVVSAPVGFAPIGINKIYHPLGELPVATVAKELNLPYCLSTAGSTAIEKVAEANGQGPRFYQLYMPHDDELTVSLLTRAFKSGFDVCMLTTDTWQLGWRHDDIAAGNYAFYRGIGADIGLTDPVFRKRLEEMGIDPEKDPQRAGAAWIDSVWHGRAWTWEKIPWLIKTWKDISGGRPFLLKGIQSVEDAKKAVEIGCDGIVVSNHAGRQVDGAIASLDALENIVAAVGDQIYITYDSGIRGAADVVKALALGAKFVFVGRLWVWGLSIMGETGVRHVMKSLLADLDILMCVGGFQNVDQIDKSVL